MAQGFCVKPVESISSTIQSLKKSSLFQNENVEYWRKHWTNEYASVFYDPFSAEELFTPSRYNYMKPSIGVIDTNSVINGLRVHECFQQGFWGLRITQDLDAKKGEEEWTLTISVKAGSHMCFHPLEAKSHILHYHCPAVYQEWKQMVLNDLINFKHALAAFNPHRHLISTACSVSSERICRKLDFPVSEGRVFLLKSNNKVCLHKQGAYCQ